MRRRSKWILPSQLPLLHALDLATSEAGNWKVFFSVFSSIYTSEMDWVVVQWCGVALLKDTQVTRFQGTHFFFPSSFFPLFFNPEL